MNAQSASSAALSSWRSASVAASSSSSRGLLVGAALGRQPRRLDQQQPARLEQRRLTVLRVHAAQHRQRLEPAGAAPVEHARGVAVADLDQPQLLEPPQRLADRGHVDVEIGGERPLRRQPLARGVAAGEDRLAQLGEHEIGNRGAGDRRGHCSGTVSVFGTVVSLTQGTATRRQQRARRCRWTRRRGSASFQHEFRDPSGASSWTRSARPRPLEPSLRQRLHEPLGVVRPEEQVAQAPDDHRGGSKRRRPSTAPSVCSGAMRACTLSASRRTPRRRSGATQDCTSSSRIGLTVSGASSSPSGAPFAYGRDGHKCDAAREHDAASSAQERTHAAGSSRKRRNWSAQHDRYVQGAALMTS